MLYRAMNSAASGMDAFIFNLDTIANNLANSATTGFKRSRTDFEDLYYQYYKPPGSPDVQGNQAPDGIFAGSGVRVSAVQPDFTQGSLLDTGRQTDLAITGDGFFSVTDNIQTFYTRNGQFTINAANQLVLASGNRSLFLDPPITIDPTTVEISISADGVVSVLLAGNNTLQQVGNIQLTRFINPEGLLAQGDTLFLATDAAGPPQGPDTPDRTASAC